MSALSIGWVGGPRTQIELSFEDGQILVRYAPGHRSTVRIPAHPQAFGAFGPVDRLMSGLGTNGLNRHGVVGAVTVPGDPDPDLKTIGELLVGALPPYLVSELQRSEMNLELGLSENVLCYPWELMFDDQSFLCLRHNVSRYINATSLDFQSTRVPSWWDAKLDEIRVLVVSVPNPAPREGNTFDPLDSVDSEARAVIKAVAKLPYCKAKWLQNPSFVDLHRELSAVRYHIVHYCGHAEFGGDKQGKLILQTDDMPAQVWKTLVQRTEAVVCVLNGCETARQDAAFGGGRLGLARAVLDTGAYLIGSAWKVNDVAADAFAQTFYHRFLGDLSSIGAAVRLAREACRAAQPSLPAWASYVLYGDPRLRLEQIAAAPPVTAPGG